MNRKPLQFMILCGCSSLALSAQVELVSSFCGRNVVSEFPQPTAYVQNSQIQDTLKIDVYDYVDNCLAQHAIGSSFVNDTLTITISDTAGEVATCACAFSIGLACIGIDTSGTILHLKRVRRDNGQVYTVLVQPLSSGMAPILQDCRSKGHAKRTWVLQADVVRFMTNGKAVHGNQFPGAIYTRGNGFLPSRNRTAIHQ